jgi:hypothetical protein
MWLWVVKQKTILLTIKVTWIKFAAKGTERKKTTQLRRQL